MNNAKLWLVVSPNIGIPIFLGAVAIGSFAVHLALVKNTTWIQSFHQGEDIKADSAALTEEGAAVATASYAMPAADGGTEITVILPDGTHAKAILQSSERMASASQ